MKVTKATIVLRGNRSKFLPLWNLWCILHYSPYVVWVDYWCGCWLKSTWLSSYKWLLVCKHVGVAWGLDVTFN